MAACGCWAVYGKNIIEINKSSYELLKDWAKTVSVYILAKALKLKCFGKTF